MKIAAYLIEKIGSTVSGYFHPSLWLSESHELLVAQRFDGIELGRLDGRPHAEKQANAYTHGDARDGGPGGHLARPVQAPADQENHKVDQDRKSTRLNSSHLGISYAVFCLKKKKKKNKN